MSRLAWLGRTRGGTRHVSVPPPDTRTPDGAVIVTIRNSPETMPVGEFPQPKRALLAEAIADSVAEAVATRHMLPDERIVETALASRYAVSRVPVREALKILSTQGILVGGGHRGYRIASFSPKKIEQVFEVRLQLETILLRDAIANWRRDGSDLCELDSVVEAMRTAARAGDLREVLRADLKFHRTICQAAKNEVAAALWNAIARHVLIIFNLARHRDVDLEGPVKQHVKLRAYIRARIDDPAAATDDVSAVLEEHFQPRRRAKPRSDAATQRSRSRRQSRNSASVSSSGG